jgi:hypothetical protein
MPITEAIAHAPVCGCDHLTYWNEGIAAVHGVNVSGNGACALAAAVTCKQSSTCDGEARCNLDQGTKIGCTVAALDPVGTCWVVPKVCGINAAAPRVKACGTNTCATLCQAITNEATTFYSQNVTGCQ